MKELTKYKYRAKKVDTKDWVRGYGVVIGDGFCLIPYVIRGNIQDFKFVTITCDMNTLCRHTGLKDKNDKEIYEGDIIECWSEGSKARGVVRQRMDGLWFMYPAWQDAKMWMLMPDDDGNTTVEIIGNIHDNPELIRDIKEG